MEVQLSPPPHLFLRWTARIKSLSKQRSTEEKAIDTQHPLVIHIYFFFHFNTGKQLAGALTAGLGECAGWRKGAGRAPAGIFLHLPESGWLRAALPVCGGLAPSEGEAGRSWKDL